ncbi:Clp protease N-terminal domain-containing protein [Actinomycetospora cinnamomea]|uniref:ClpA/ClpB-like protein n=1 Tax=Actinomycetospora cinnamomea TaxID=663609 RepID=A0A2U1EYH1_9PSEU|nr:Clp protease N-terminal domain-containing protein [Actinomycetospora cinnamomea]PVZ04949.1 ClpA/ClpB-like protein [Actinomycetospora cinnamomea]
MTVLSGPGNDLPARPASPGTGASCDQELMSWAHGLGAVQEAERVGSWRVGTEHLLVASLLDPIARRLAHEAGGDFSAVQAQVGRPVDVGIGARPGVLPAPDEMHLSDGSVRALGALQERTGREADLTGWVRRDRSTDPRGRSVVRRRLLALLLEETAPGGARRVVDALGLTAQATWLIGRLGEPDPSVTL